MIRIKHILLGLLAGMLGLMAAGCGGGGTEEFRLVSASQTLIVSQTAPQGWFAMNQAHSTVNFVAGPATPPFGAGSVEFATGPTALTAPFGGKPTLSTLQFDGGKLADLDTLSYWTFQQQVAPTHPHLSVGIKLQVDIDGNGTRDTTLVFEPVYVLAGQGPVLPGVWQDWDTLSGNGWWNTATVPGFPGGGSSFFSMATFTTAFPNATIVSWHPGLEGAGFNFGAGQNSGGFWSDFIGNVDGLAISFGPDTTTYNFERTTKDDCKKGGWEAMGFRNQGQCVSAHVPQ